MNVRTTSTATAVVVGLVIQLSAQEVTQQRTVLVSVIDEDGRAVPDLTAANFRGKLQGEAVNVLSATLDTSPRHVAGLPPIARTG